MRPGYSYCILLVCLGSCGRIGFDLGDGLDQSDAAVSPTATVGSEVLLPATEAVHELAAAWSGTDIAIAYADDESGGVDSQTVHFMRVYAEGANLSGESTLANGDFPSLAWSGSDYGLAYIDPGSGQRSLRFVRLDSQGKSLGPAIELSTAASVRSAVASNGSQWSVGLRF